MTWIDAIIQVLTYEFKIGSIPLSLLALLEFVVLIAIVFVVATAARELLLSRVLRRTGMSDRLQKVIARFAGYIVVFIGLTVSFQIVGINLGSLAFLAGALGLGLGFGLQNIISNFVSGIIILIERPIQVGDRIDVGGLEGDVVEIKARSTTIITNDNIAIIVPNSEFISSRIINWSHGDPKVRFRIPVGVAYGSDPRHVEKVLLEVAAEVPDVLKQPQPVVRFMSFGDSALNFELRVWNEMRVHAKGNLVSDINFRVYDKFQQHGIEIPYPQRDVHIRTTVAPSTAPALTTQQTIAHNLRRTPLFGVLSDEDLLQLADRAVLRRYRPGQTIIEQDSQGDSMFLIGKGTAQVKLRHPDGTVARVGTLVRGDFFGEVSIDRKSVV